MHSFLHSDSNNSPARAAFRAGQSVYRSDSPGLIRRRRTPVRAEASRSLATHTPSPGAGFQYRLSRSKYREAEAQVLPWRRAPPICPFATCAWIRPFRSGLSRPTSHRRRSKQCCRACVSGRSAMRRGQRRQERHQRRHRQLLQSAERARLVFLAQGTLAQLEMRTTGIVASVTAALSSGSVRRLRRRAAHEPCQF